jgi:hypothetical protein
MKKSHNHLKSPGISLPRRTVAQLKKKASNFNYYLLAMNESIDLSHDDIHLIKFVNLYIH